PAATVSGINIDKTTPTIAYTGQAPAANAAGWNKADVQLQWSCADALSGPAAPSVTQDLVTEGTHLQATGTCSDLAGNSAAHADGDVNIDKTPPTATAGASPAANPAGWNKTDV